ncbi:hypothetical protein KKH39_04525 [Patescibacteria group bacterium]|nr:hypothetical protein [Patescibacteria group bacterium]
MINNKGAIALIFVIMITTLTIVAGLTVSLLNISDLTSSYHVSESEQVSVENNACIDDALYRIASSTDATGTYYLSELGTKCYYEISSVIDGGLKTVTSTASTTSDVGYWEDTVIVMVNVSTTPVSIYSYKNSNMSYNSFTYCGDSSCNGIETCSTCGADCGVCAVCGNGTIEGDEACDDSNTVTESCGDGDTTVGGCSADCSASLGLNETCDDGNVVTESCGDGTLQSGSGYCNATCSAAYAGGEACDYTGVSCGGSNLTFTSPVGCTRNPYCAVDCGSCVSECL